METGTFRPEYWERRFKPVAVQALLPVGVRRSRLGWEVLDAGVRDMLNSHRAFSLINPDPAFFTRESSS